MKKPPHVDTCARPLFAEVQVGGAAYLWSEADGLEAEAVLGIRRWIVRCAWPYLQKAAALHLEADDLVQAGNIGALKAARTYDPSKGRTYLSWATRRIKDEMAALCRCPAQASLDEDGAPEPPDPDVADPGAAIEAEQVLKCLPKRDRELLAAHYGIGTGRPLTLTAMAEQHGVSPRRVNQLINQALSRARRRLNK